MLNPEEFVIGPDEYLEQLRKTKEAVDIPVFASLNGYTLGGWLDYAVRLEEVGADALELNLYYVATDPSESASDLEQRAVEMVREVQRAVKIPVTIKLSPFYHFACTLCTATGGGRCRRSGAV